MLWEILRQEESTSKIFVPGIKGGLTSFLFYLLFRVPIADIFQTKKRRKRQVGGFKNIIRVGKK